MRQFLFAFILKNAFAQFLAPMPMEIVPQFLPVMPPVYPMNDIYNYYGNHEYHPILDIASSIAKIVELKKTEDIVEQERLLRSRPAPLPTWFTLPAARSRPNFQLIPYRSLPYQRGHPSSNIVNSIPLNKVPSDMFKIGDLLTYNKHDKEFIYDLDKIRGFPIVKGEQEGSFPIVVEEKREEKIRGIDIPRILRKILGFDELPTAEEGNAIAQLLGNKKT